MHFNSLIIPFIAGHEGFVGRWYRDPVGVPTIGYGFTWNSTIFRQWWLAKYSRKFKAGDTISQRDALNVLHKIIETEYKPFVINAAKNSHGLNKNQAAACLDMVYNCGPRALKWKWFSYLHAGNLTQAATRYAQTATTARGRRLPGLIRRRKEASKILLSGKWPDWVNARSTEISNEPVASWALAKDDFRQGLMWLSQLGFYKGELTISFGAEIVKRAVLAFQKQHSQLVNDGILGRATLDQIQRTIDLKSKVNKSVLGGGAVVTTGIVDNATQVSGYGVTAILCGMAATALIVGWLAWTYRDELKIAISNTKGLR